MLVEAHGKGGTGSAGLIVRGWYRTPGFEVGGFLRLEIGKRRNGLGRKGALAEMSCGKRKQEAPEEFVVAGFIEPRAFDVKEPEARHEARQREGVDRELRERLAGARVGLVIKDVDRAVAGLQKVDVSGNVTRLVAGGGARRVYWLPRQNRDPVKSSSAAISSSQSQTGTSTASVALSSGDFCFTGCVAKENDGL